MKKVRYKLRPTLIGVIKTFSLSPNGEIGEIAVECTGCTYYYNNLAELCEKWEDYEELKEYWMINSFGDVEEVSTAFSEEMRDELREIGNYFETREEAEKAVEKLKDWKRLKDKGFRLNGGVLDSFFCLDIYMRGEAYEAIKDDLKIVFGGEE